jgi:pyruvate/2-oxoglutarate/acetoin dehydrogenase E1 component
MVKSDAQWLIDVFEPKRKQRIDHTTISMFVKAINIIMEQNRKVPTCGCEYKVTAQIANSLFDQHYNEIMSLYNESTRGRKKKS